jgi:hypothetical protein
MTDISRYVLGIRQIGGWLKMTEDAFGKDFSDRCERYDDALIEGEKLAEKYYYETERVKVRKSIREWIAEMSDFAEECRERRKSELQETIEKAKSRLSDLMQHRGDVEKKKELLSGIKTLERKLETDITDDDIERARNFPIENLLEVGRNGMALCIGHDDKRPSMNCKNNFAYCHSCGFHADSIGIYMKLNNAGFIEAVKALS